MKETYVSLCNMNPYINNLDNLFNSFKTYEKHRRCFTRISITFSNTAVRKTSKIICAHQYYFQ